MLRRSSAIVCLSLVAWLIPGCAAPELPMSPSSFTTGIILYEHANFLGNSAHITSDVRDLRDFTGPCVHEDGNGSVSRDWNDCVSSVRVAPGWRGTLYRGADFDDDALEVAEDVANLQLVSGDCPKDGMNDCVTSVRVRQ